MLPATIAAASRRVAESEENLMSAITRCDRAHETLAVHDADSTPMGAVPAMGLNQGPLGFGSCADSGRFVRVRNGAPYCAAAPVFK